MSRTQHGPIDGFIGAIVDALDERLTARLTELVQARQAQPYPDPPYFDQVALAERLRVSARTLEKWRHRGKGPPYRQAGKRVLYPSAGVSRWLEGGDGDSAVGITPKVSKRRLRRVAT